MLTAVGIDKHIIPAPKNAFIMGGNVPDLFAGKEIAVVHNLTITRYLSLDTTLRDFEKTSVSCGFAGLLYEKFCRLLTDYSGIGQ